MTQSCSRVQVVSSMLALVLLLSTLPLNSSVVVVSDKGGPEFTINICQPAQLFGQASNNIIARPSANLPQLVLFSFGPLKATPLAVLTEHQVSPETPPPKPFI